ncbi:MAG: hypothetical protein IAF02_25925 [Anaerolineae bacterium]|nr:hypothetical protein [Anaerolineae bacterium]
MPASNFSEYVQSLQDKVNFVVSSGEARLIHLTIESRSSFMGLIAGILQFKDESELHFREFVNVNLAEPRQMYAYHYQDQEKNLVFRYDNAAHRPHLSQPEHKHTPHDIVIGLSPLLVEVIDEILFA